MGGPFSGLLPQALWSQAAGLVRKGEGVNGSGGILKPTGDGSGGYGLPP